MDVIQAAEHNAQATEKADPNETDGILEGDNSVAIDFEKHKRLAAALREQPGMAEAMHKAAAAARASAAAAATSVAVAAASEAERALRECAHAQEHDLIAMAEEVELARQIAGQHADAAAEATRDAAIRDEVVECKNVGNDMLARAEKATSAAKRQECLCGAERAYTT